ALEIPADKVLQFSHGIPGFPHIQEFALIELDNIKPFCYLQALGEPPVSLLVVNPFLIVPNYEFRVGEKDMEELQAKAGEEVSVYSVVTFPGNAADATLNLMAPVLINAAQRRGKQVILIDGKYSARHSLLMAPPDAKPDSQ